MKRLRFSVVAGTVLVVAGIATASLLGVTRMEAAPIGLSQADLDAIVAQAVAKAGTTASGFRVTPSPHPTRMQIAIVARDGKLLRLFSMADAWVGSIDIAIAKGRTAAFSPATKTRSRAGLSA